VFLKQHIKKYIKSRNAVRVVNRDSAGGCCVGDTEFNYRQEPEILFFFKTPGRLRPLNQTPGRKFDHSSPSSAEVKSVWSWTLLCSRCTPSWRGQGQLEMLTNSRWDKGLMPAFRFLHMSVSMFPHCNSFNDKNSLHRKWFCARFGALTLVLLKIHVFLVLNHIECYHYFESS